MPKSGQDDIIPARTTDGTKPVTAIKPKTPSAARQARSGAADEEKRKKASRHWATMAVVQPDTASRWETPVTRKSF